MNIAAEREKLAQQLLQVNDYQLLAAVKHLLDFGLKRQNEVQPAHDFLDDLTPSQKADFDKAIGQLDRGEGIPHEQAMAIIK